MKLVPNCITLSRTLLALLLFWLEPLGAGFTIVYILCGITDMLDGPIARKTGTISSLGAKLDSLADMTLVGAALYTLYPFLGLTPRGSPLDHADRLNPWCLHADRAAQIPDLREHSYLWQQTRRTPVIYHTSAASVYSSRSLDCCCMYRSYHIRCGGIHHSSELKPAAAGPKGAVSAALILSRYTPKNP